ncbi:hypothetical protein [Mucilaginibacter auburnensis]|uniref:Uncharacterized protein n=1 Tax=Mucilaginibacter auburnensis TaxID=1457233 RepID=A0A2H9VVQ8_9SPHI|nr:hypothetical protein [Mucilaginibacter auburnensis]PJJ84906.1 hypothetical protein CLV57_1928 [Mucilaginibacter auburnensis]
MKKLIILTVAIVLSATVASRSKTTVPATDSADFSTASFSPKAFLATAD